MKKFWIGLIVGLILAIPVGAHADEVISLVGKTIQGEFDVSLNGKKLNNRAIVIDGTSYVPIREIGESFGLDVSFDSNKGISLKQKESNDDAKLKADNDRAQKYQDLLKQSQDLDKKIESLSPILQPYEQYVRDAQGNLYIKEKDDTYYTTKAKRDALISQRDDIDKQLDALRNQQ
jgi:hypothetical protein